MVVVDTPLLMICTYSIVREEIHKSEMLRMTNTSHDSNGVATMIVQE